MTALVYWLLGVVGLSLAIAPGYISPIFPAAGFALAMTVFSKGKAWPGIWLGSLFLNLWVAWTHGGTTTAVGLAALGIATGSACQAMVAYWLLKRHALSCRHLETTGDVIRSLFWGGPVACVISASVGTFSLIAMSLIPASDHIHFWWTWWVGDTLGVVVAMPMTMAILHRKEPQWHKRLKTVIVPTSITLGLVTAAYFAAAVWERSEQRAMVEQHGQTIARLLEQRFIAHQEALSSLKRLIEVMPEMNFQQFEHLTAVTLRDNPDIFALSFNSFVPLKQRAEYEKRFALRTGNTAFEIKERNSEGQLVRASDRSSYVAVSYIAPLEGNMPAIGYDIFSEPIRRRAITSAIISREAAVTAPIRLVQESRERVGVLALHPAYRKEGTAADSTSDALFGFAVGVIKVDEMIHIATKPARIEGLAFEVEDAETRQPIYRSSNVGRPADRAEILEWHITASDRVWNISVWTTSQHIRKDHLWITWAVGATGLAMAALLQVLMLVTTGATAIVERKVRDQTQELRKKSEALTDRNAQLSALFRLSPDGLVALSPQGFVTFANPAFQFMTGISASEIVGTHVDDCLERSLRSQAESPETFPAIAACFSDARHSALTLTLRMPRYTVLQLVGVRNEAAGTSQFLYFRDITKEAEINRMKSDFLAHAAHELRTPLTSIHGYAELLLKRELDAEIRHDLLETIYLQTSELGDIINELLDLERIETRQGKDFNIESVSLVPLVQKTLNHLSFDSSRWPLELRVETPTAMVKADRAKLGQVLVNILNNAQKYSPDGGKIEVEIISKAGMSGVLVRDHGIGMTSDEVQRLGERFWRADTSGRIPGTGLGMSIVMDVLKILGGEVNVASTPNVGTTVTLWFQDAAPQLGSETLC